MLKPEGLQGQWGGGGLSESAGQPNRDVWCHLDRATQVCTEVSVGMKCEQRSTKDIVRHRTQQRELEGRFILPPVTGPSKLPASCAGGGQYQGPRSHGVTFYRHGIWNLQLSLLSPREGSGVALSSLPSLVLCSDTK